MREARLYYEAHVNFERNAETELAGKRIEDAFSNWKLATFEMHKDKEPTGFITGRHKSLYQIKRETLFVVTTLRSWGFNVLRWKIEDTVLDSKHGDQLFELAK